MSHPKPLLNEFLNISRKKIKERKKQLNELIEHYLSYPYNLLNGETLKNIGWHNGGFFNYYISMKNKSNYDLGLTINYGKNDDRNNIKFNNIFLLDSNVDEFIKTLKHEIAHAVDLTLFNKSKHGPHLMKITKILFNDPELGRASTKIDIDLSKRYTIIFEKYFGREDGFIKEVKEIPNGIIQRNDPGYIYTTVLDKSNYYKFVTDFFPDRNELNNITKNLSPQQLININKKTLRLNESMSFNNKQFLLDENYKNYVKSLLAGLTLSTAPLINDFSNLNAAPNSNNKTNIVQTNNSFKIYKNSDDINILAGTIYDEARGESSEGRYAVASVIWNRAHQKRWSKLGLVGVCLQRMQFSGWNKGYLNIQIINKKQQQIWDECKQIAKQMLNNNFKPIINSNHYYNPKLASPSWGNKMKNIKYIGNHKFGIL